MSETFIFDVPIYRTAKEIYNKDQKLYIEECLYNHSELSVSEMKNYYREYPDKKIRNSDYYWRKYGGPWRYNDIIGYIRLYLDGYVVQGQLWYIDVKRVVRKPRHKILFCQNTRFGSPVGIPTQSSNREIFNLIKKYLDSVLGCPWFKNRFVDTSLLYTLGPYVDWKTLIEKNIAI